MLPLSIQTAIKFVQIYDVVNNFFSLVWKP